MKRSELAPLGRSASKLVGDPRILVIGSQAILASFDEDQLPGAGLVDIELLRARAELLPVIPAIKRRVIDWLATFGSSELDRRGVHRSGIFSTRRDARLDVDA